MTDDWTLIFDAAHEAIWRRVPEDREAKRAYERLATSSAPLPKRPDVEALLREAKDALLDTPLTERVLLYDRIEAALAAPAPEEHKSDLRVGVDERCVVCRGEWPCQYASPAPEGEEHCCGDPSHMSAEYLAAIAREYAALGDSHE